MCLSQFPDLGCFLESGPWSTASRLLHARVDESAVRFVSVTSETTVKYEAIGNSNPEMSSNLSLRICSWLCDWVGIPHRRLKYFNLFIL